MTCDRVLDGPAAQVFAAQTPPFGPGPDAVHWVERVEVWFTEEAEGVDFTEFRVFDGARRRKTIRVVGY